MSRKTSPWAKESIFKDKDGRTVIEFEVIEGSERGNKVYKGQVMLNIKVSQDPRVPQEQRLFEFDFQEGKGLNWVRKHFDDQADKAIKLYSENEHKKASEKRKAIVPAKVVPQMLGPNGKPVG